MGQKWQTEKIRVLEMRNANRRGKDYRQGRQEERWQAQEKRNEGLWKKRKKKKKRRKSAGKGSGGRNAKKVHHKSFCDEVEKRGEGKQTKDMALQSKANVGEIRKLFFLFLIPWQNWLSVSAASEGSQSSTEAVTRDAAGMLIKESSWTEVAPKRWKQPRRGGLNEHAEICKKLLGALCYMSRRGTFDIFVGMEHILRKEEMEEQNNKEAKERWRFAADAARITDENANSEYHKHTSGGAFVTVDSNVGAVVGTNEGTVESIPGYEGEALVNVRGGMRVFSVYFWHSERWTLRNEVLFLAVVKQVTATRHPWLIACDTSMCPQDCEESQRFKVGR